MTTINGTITDSTGNSLDGTLTVTLPAVVTNDSTDPDTIYTQRSTDFTITAGSVGIDLPETETQGVAYRFVFVDSNSDQWLDFNAIVPNVGTIDFATLIPTGTSNVNLDTGAFRVARLLAKDPQLSLLYKQPMAVSMTLESEANTKKLFIPKPFDGQMAVRGLSVLAISGYTDWSFELGVVNSNGNDVLLTPVTDNFVTENGRRRYFKTYDETLAASVLGLYMRAVQTASTPVTATLLATFLEV